MGSNINFRNFVTEPAPSSTNRPPVNSPLARQSSVYALTFDEFQNTLGGTGKDFGSMNMDELLKSIWSAEENQTMASTSVHLDGNGVPGSYLQRQGSLTLPRTLSQKTVDEVWRGISKEFSIGKDGIIGTAGGSSVQYHQNQTQRQPTLGEMTLEEFLVRAGVVREDLQLDAKPNNGGFFGELSQVGNNNSGLGFGFQQTNRTSDLMGMSNLGSVTPLPIQSPANLSLNINAINGVSSNPQLQGFQQQQQQSILPKQAAVPFASQVPSSAAVGAHLVSPGMRGGLMGLADHQVMLNNMAQGDAFQGVELGMVGLRGGATGVSTGSPESSDGISRSNGETSSVSPVPYMFNGAMRGRKGGGPLEKVVERRHRRMIKNRESAARSRARKQAYTMELEAEVAKLKEENEVLRKKRAEIMELQKNEVVEMMHMQRGGGGKRRCLRRTQTGPW